jgi:hypothetical protein
MTINIGAGERIDHPAAGDGRITELCTEIARLREQKLRWMALADQRAIEVGTLKTEIKRLRQVIESRTE